MFGKYYILTFSSDLEEAKMDSGESFSQLKIYSVYEKIFGSSQNKCCFADSYIIDHSFVYVCFS